MHRTGCPCSISEDASFLSDDCIILSLAKWQRDSKILMLLLFLTAKISVLWKTRLLGKRTVVLGKWCLSSYDLLSEEIARDSTCWIACVVKITRNLVSLFLITPTDTISTLAIFTIYIFFSFPHPLLKSSSYAFLFSCRDSNSTQILFLLFI